MKPKASPIEVELKRTDAEQAAWGGHGVSEVDDRLVVTIQAAGAQRPGVRPRRDSSDTEPARSPTAPAPSPLHVVGVPEDCMRRFTTKFTNRSEAGRELAGTLDAFRDRQDVIVLGLPRGGVPVAYEVADALRAPLDVFTVRKLGAPGNEEYAIGAIATGGIVAIDRAAMRVLGVSDAALEALIDRERRELVRRERLYRGDRAMPSLAGKTVIVVDDGLATGASMTAAVTALRQREPKSIVVATPVASSSACASLRRIADACVCVLSPEPFYGVGMWYADFEQTTDDEVRALLAAGRTPAAEGSPANAALTV